ncbi:MAG: thiamine pyrophosphate-binding protein [Acidobacteria bacterium]|nr:MAG: thiamine pyrophosphate-binding protein [Acidobacteriota bacterium]
MAKKTKTKSVDRRNFLKTAAASAALAVTKPGATEAQQAPPAPRNASAPVLARPAAAPAALVVDEAKTIDRPGSDFMVDVIKSLGFEYMFGVPANTYMSVQESIVNYGRNKDPEFILATNEDLAAAMAHGYAKIAGKPALVGCHGTVGAQHATMGIYDAFCDRVPMVMILGNIFDAAKRGTGKVAWVHSAQDAAALVRDMTKWDDAPHSLPHFAESMVRAYKIAMTPPMMPVALVLDVELQEEEVPANADLHIPKLGTLVPPAADPAAVAEVAKLLVAAEHPVIVVDRVARTPEAIKHMIELAETLQAAVVDRKGRMNFPNRHPLEQTRSRMGVANADVVLGIEVIDFAGIRSQRAGSKRISITANDLFAKSNYTDYLKFAETDIAIQADGEATLPLLVDAVKRLITPDRKRLFEERGAKLAAAHKEAFDQYTRQAAIGWNDSPVSTARVTAELWPLIKNEDWSLVADLSFFQDWPMKLWNFDKHYQFIGGPGGYGIGYGAPAAVGAAIANKKYGRISINIQQDGDLMMGPGSLWTAANHHLPLLTIMHNNQGFHNECMEAERLALRRGRDGTRAHIGNRLIEPVIDYAKMAESMGMHGEGPITDPSQLGPALKRAMEVVKRGEPAMVDVRTQPR